MTRADDANAPSAGPTGAPADAPTPATEVAPAPPDAPAAPGAAGGRPKKAIPEGLWVQCPACGASLFRRSLEANLHVCLSCRHHMRVDATTRIEQLVDTGTFEPLDEQLRSTDPLSFSDSRPYPQRLASAMKKTGRTEAVRSGIGYVKGRRTVFAVMDFSFLGGSMGSVVGERITRAVERAEDDDLPLVIVSASGGARMMESGLSLMQMAKTSAALARFGEGGGLFVSVLTDPTTGGVTASFAMLGDVILAEPGALIGFAGPRVIAQTIRQELPAGFQRAEFLERCGFVDRVVSRHELRSEISSIIDYAGK